MTDANLTQKFQTADGFNLAYRQWKATKPKRNVVCIHGIGDYSGWFNNIAPHLAADGSSVFALDLRGFGESREAKSPRGIIHNFGRHLQDIDDFAIYLRRHSAVEKLFVLGHSLGGIYSVWYAANHPASVDGLVLAAPAVVSSISDICSGDASNRDQEEIKIMLNDPLETWDLPTSYLSNVVNLLLKNVLDNATLVHAPTLILQGEADVTVHPEGAKQLYSKLGCADKRLELFADAGHWFYDALSPASPRSKCSVEKRRIFIAAVKDWLNNH